MDENSKPNGEAAGWRRMSTRYPFSYRMFHIRQDRVRVNGLHEFDYAYIESRGAVWVVPATSDGRIILIKQYRYSVDEWVWEVPAGGLHDHNGDAESLARRELREEIGGEAERLQYLGYFYGGVAITDSKCHVFLAHNTRLAHEPAREPAETMVMHPVPIEQAMRMARAGEMRDGRSALALLWCEPYLKRET